MADYVYRAAYEFEWEEIMDLAWRTFEEFEAPEYPEEGINNFREFVTDETLYKMFVNGAYQVFVALDGEKLIGMISLRDVRHISLLFVDKDYHRKGVGRGLVNHLREYMYCEMGQTFVTVNAAPYAEGFYHKLGFKDTGRRTLLDGIIFTPMQLVL